MPGEYECSILEVRKGSLEVDATESRKDMTQSRPVAEPFI